MKGNQLQFNNNTCKATSFFTSYSPNKNSCLSPEAGCVCNDTDVPPCDGPIVEVFRCFSAVLVTSKNTKTPSPSNLRNVVIVGSPAKQPLRASCTVANVGNLRRGYIPHVVALYKARAITLLLEAWDLEFALKQLSLITIVQKQSYAKQQTWKQYIV